MGADVFYAFYGVRFDVTDEEELEAIEEGTDPRLKAARRAGLKVCLDRLTDGEPHFLFVGHELGAFGVQADGAASVGKDELAARTEAKLREGGFDGTPRLHLQLAAQY
jgi:hypothetical protein